MRIPIDQAQAKRLCGPHFTRLLRGEDYAPLPGVWVERTVKRTVTPYCTGFKVQYAILSRDPGLIDKALSKGNIILQLNQLPS